MLARVHILGFVVLALAGCATTQENRALDELGAVSPPPLVEARGDGADVTAAEPTVVERGTLDEYVALALRNSPALRAMFDEWRAATFRIPQARRLPEPTLSYGYYVQQVETRVGPQRHRFGLKQAFPWPTRLSAGADAAALAARAAGQRFDAAALALRRQVAEAYWRLWRVDRIVTIQREQVELIRQLAEATRARLAVGATSLADVTQIDLTVARLQDALDGLAEERTKAAASLRAVVGAPSLPETPVTTRGPDERLPAVPEERLVAVAAEHPGQGALGLSAEAAEARARAADAQRYPGFAVGIDYIETGPAAMPGTADSGKDPIIIGLAIQLPIWTGVYDAAEEEARAEAAALRARRAAALDRRAGQIASLLAEIRDAHRRGRVLQTTLLPQAETAYSAVLGAYDIGDSSVAAILLAQRELLELRRALVDVHARLGVAWAQLEDVVGAPIEREDGEA